MTLAVNIGANSISLYVDGEFFQVDKNHANHAALLQALRKNPRDLEEILGLVELPKFISKVTAGRVEISEDEVLFAGQKVGGYMVDRLLSMAASGDEVQSWARFMDNLMDNPLPSVREDLYKWMEAANLPITEDGCITAFKKVRANYHDVHTGKFDNSPGSVLEMPREQCDTNRHQTCSTGFHFCSAGYLRNFGGEKVMVVKINPRDVTAIPSDYNNHKARCCRYVVVGELKSESAAKHKVWTEKSVVSLEDPRELPEVMLPRKGKSLAEIAHDPARVDGPAPADDLAVEVDATPAAKAKKNSAKKKTSAAKKKSSAPPPAPEKTGLIFERGSRVYTEKEVSETLSRLGLTKAAAELDVPKSTLSGWAKKISA